MLGSNAGVTLGEGGGVYTGATDTLIIPLPNPNMGGPIIVYPLINDLLPERLRGVGNIYASLEQFLVPGSGALGTGNINVAQQSEGTGSQSGLTFTRTDGQTLTITSPQLAAIQAWLRGLSNPRSGCKN